MSSDAWDKAVKDHYGFDDVAGVEEAWLAQVRKDAKAQPLPKDAAGKGPAIKSVPPVIGRAVIDSEGRVVLRKPVSYYQPRTQYAKDTSGQGFVPVTNYELAITEQVTRYDLKDVAATDVNGKPVDPKTLAKRLRTETAVLIAAAGKEVDPYYLTVVREGTIILALPNGGQPMAIPGGPPLADPTPLPQTTPR